MKLDLSYVHNPAWPLCHLSHPDFIGPRQLIVKCVACEGQGFLQGFFGVHVCPRCKGHGVSEPPPQEIQDYINAHRAQNQNRL